MKLLFATFPTVFLVVFGQLLTKWRISQLSSSVSDVKSGAISKIFYYLLDPYIFLAYATSFIASAAWFLVVEKYQISNAFPIYIGTTVLLVGLGGVYFFNEDLNVTKIISYLLIIVGVYFASR